METSPAFFEGKSERRVRVFLESGFCTGPSPGPSPSPVRVSQYALLACEAVVLFFGGLLKLLACQ